MVIEKSEIGVDLKLHFHYDEAIRVHIESNLSNVWERLDTHIDTHIH